MPHSKGETTSQSGKSWNSPGRAFEADASPRLQWTAAALCVAYVAFVVAVLPVADRPGPVVPAATTAFGMGMLVADLCISALLLVQFRAAPSWSILLLSVAYLYSAAMALLHLLVFPGAWIVDQPLFGTQQTVGWLFIPWMVGYPALVLSAVFALRLGRLPPERADRARLTAVVSVFAVVLGVFIVAAAAPAWLPEQIEGNVFGVWGIAAPWMSVALSIAAFGALLLATRWESALYIWLGAALLAFAGFNALAASGGGRYTVGWDLSRVSGLISASLLLVFFIVQFARLHSSLASTLIDLRRANETLESRIAERTADLQAAKLHLEKALKDRGLLLREVYHRVKNNLQTIDSLISIEDSGRNEGLSAEAVEDLRRRVNALGLVHQQLISSGDLATLDIRPYLEDLLRNIAVSSGSDRRGIKIGVDSDSLAVGLDLAIPLGLLVTELVSNAVKHAFPNGYGTVTVRFRNCPDGTIILSVEDDGTGTVGQVGQATSGLRIVEALVAQLGGKLHVQQNTGTHAEVRMASPAVLR